jgi:predicted RNA-binding protein with PIN domain
MEEILIVDGYNIIGDWPELRELKNNENLEEARSRLLDYLADYQAYTGRKVIIVFDAHQVPGRGKKLNTRRLQVHYTSENETADERIERLVKEMNQRRKQIYVATSDRTEQWVVFAQGALRISARELSIEVTKSREKIAEKVKKTADLHSKITLRETLGEEIEKIFEKWRRE